MFFVIPHPRPRNDIIRSWRFERARAFVFRRKGTPCLFFPSAIQEPRFRFLPNRAVPYPALKSIRCLGTRTHCDSRTSCFLLLLAWSRGQRPGTRTLFCSSKPTPSTKSAVHKPSTKSNSVPVERMGRKLQEKRSRKQIPLATARDIVFLNAWRMGGKLSIAFFRVFPSKKTKSSFSCLYFQEKTNLY